MSALPLSFAVANTEPSYQALLRERAELKRQLVAAQTDRDDAISLLTTVIEQALGLTEAELKVLLFVIRQTVGCGRESALLTQSNFAQGIFSDDGRLLCRGTGLCYKSVARAVKLLQHKRWLEIAGQLRTRGTGNGTAQLYSLGLRARALRPWADNIISIGGRNDGA